MRQPSYGCPPYSLPQSFVNGRPPNVQPPHKKKRSPENMLRYGMGRPASKTALLDFYRQQAQVLAGYQFASLSRLNCLRFADSDLVGKRPFRSKTVSWDAVSAQQMKPGVRVTRTPGKGARHIPTCLPYLITACCLVIVRPALLVMAM